MGLQQEFDTQKPTYAIQHKHWVQGLDLNQGPSGYETDALA